MITLIRTVIWKFFYDPVAAARWLRGGLMFLGGMGVNILAFPLEVVETWTVKQWAFRIAAAGAMGLAGTIVGGEKNKPIEAVRKELSALPYDGVERRAAVPSKENP